jgi:hypothetical protein
MCDIRAQQSCVGLVMDKEVFADLVQEMTRCVCPLAAVSTPPSQHAHCTVRIRCVFPRQHPSPSPCSLRFLITCNASTVLFCPFVRHAERCAAECGGTARHWLPYKQQPKTTS